MPDDKLKFLVYDDGLSVEHAVRLARDGNEVKYFTPYMKAFIQFQDYAPGLGMDGLEKSDNFFEDVDWADVIVFPDIGAGDLCTFLRKKGYIVYGAGILGENLENKRYEARKLQQRIGLPVQKTDLLQGVKGVRDFLKKGNGNVFIKLDKFRGDIETFYAKDYNSVETILDNVEVALGPFKNAYNFLAEESLEGSEPGWDLFFNGRQFLKPYLWGYEYKAAYIGVYTDELPNSLKLVADKLIPVLRSYDYRGAISSEVIIKGGKPYLIDVTARFPFPLSAIYTESLDNYSEVIYNIALGKDIDLKIKAKYVACLPLESGYAKDHWLRLDFDPKLRDRIKTRVGAKGLDGHYYAVKGEESVAVVLGFGSSVKGAVDEVMVNLDEINAHQLTKQDASGALYQIEEMIDKGEKKGLKFS